MKKLYLLMLAMLSCIVSANAQTTFQEDGVWYQVDWEGDELNPGNVYVIKSPDESGYTDDITINNQVIHTKTYNVSYIQSDAFKGCAGLTSVTINNTNVYSIGYEQFKGCTNLKSVTIPDNVTYIDGYAFMNCTSLESITIPNAVTYINNSAFQGCSKLETVELSNISNKLERIEWGAFQDCTSLSKITIPNSVTYVGSNAFQGCTKLTEVTLSNKLERIDYSTFQGCTSLSAIEIPASVTEIGGSAFNGCTSLTEFAIPNSVKTIGYSVFDNCTNLTSVTLPETATINGNIFYGCTSLTDVTVVVTDYAKFCTNQVLGGLENPMNYYDGTNSYNISYNLHILDNEGKEITDYVVPEGVTAIGKSAFKGFTSLSSITIPNSVNAIGDGAFYGCSNLKQVTSEISTPFDVNAFDYNTASGDPLKYSGACKLIVPSGSRTAYRSKSGWGFAYIYEKGETIYDSHQTDEQGINYTLRQANDGSFYYSVTGHSEKLKSEIVIPAEIGDCPVKAIEGAYDMWSDGAAFKGCSDLISVQIGRNVSSIGDYAFYNCTSLESITLPKKLESIGNSAFSGEYSSSTYSNQGCPLTSITIPSSVKTIGNEAFSYCSSLSLVNFEVDEDGKTNLTSIGDNAFRSCSFTSITIPNSVTTIGSSAFSYNSFLTTAILGNDLTEIKDRTFESCSSLTSVTIPDGVTSIGERAFGWCGNLTSIKIPTSLTSMGENAFESCRLTSIELPNSFTVIPANLFTNNDFEYIKLGNNVQSIGKNAFGCRLSDGEAQVVIEIPTPTPPSIANDAFPYLKDLLSVITVIVPDATAEAAYQKASVWDKMTYATMDNDVEVTVDVPGNLTRELYDDCRMMPAKVVGLKIKGTINEVDFNKMRTNFKALLRLDLSDCDITAIPDGAMRNATQLQKLTLPTKLQTIGNNAFQGCPYLTGKLDLPSGVTAIGISAFEGTYYTSVALPRSLKTIGDSAFYNLPIKQTLANLPEGLSGIGKYAFAETQVYDPVLFPHSIDELGDGAFRNTQISDVALPSKITSLNREVFQGCTNLGGIVDILVNYTEVAGFAFDGCTSLTHLRLSPNLTRMGEYAFQNTSIGYVNIPSRVKVLAQGVFKNCKKLESLALPASLEKVGPEALYGCSGLRNLSVEAIVPPAAEFSSLIGINTDLCLISIPTESFYEYLQAEFWGKFVQLRNDIAVVTEGNGDIAFESVEGGEEEEAQARARARQLMSARARTRGTTEAETEMIYVNNGSSVLVPEDGKVRFYIIPRDGETIVKATLDGVDITNDIVDGIYTAAPEKANGKLVVIFSGEAEKEEITYPIKIGSKGKTTLTSTEALDFSKFDDLKAYVATGYEGGGTIWLTRVKQVPAYTPILVKGTADELYNVPMMDKCDAYYENLFVGSAEEDIEIRFNSYEDNRSWHNYYMAGGQFKPAPDWSANNGQTIKAGKCYLRVPEWFDGNYTGDSQTFTMSKSGKSSYTPPVAIDVTGLEAQGLKAYTATGYDAATFTIWLTRINKIPAGTGVILKGDKEKTYTLPSVNVEAYYGNMFIGNTYGTITINETSDDGEWTNFYLASGSFKKVNGTREIGEQKSYLHLPTSLLVSGARGKKSAIADEWSMEELETEIMILGSIGGDDEDGTTKIDAIGNESAQPDVFYNLQGQRVDNPGKGVYIRNGKKVIIK